jgi:hypothetical protein
VLVDSPAVFRAVSDEILENLDPVDAIGWMKCTESSCHPPRLLDQLRNSPQLPPRVQGRRLAPE